MGLWSDWYSKNAGKEKYSVNAEFVLKKIDEAGNNYALLTGAVFTGSVSALSFTVTSSRTVKKNVKSFKKSALNIIKKINIVSFQYKESKDPIPHVGFIAEDTDSLLSGENQDSMRLNSTIGVLLKAVQELDGKIERIEKELKEIKSRNLK
jgi:sensor histidine kinase YesM